MSEKDLMNESMEGTMELVDVSSSNTLRNVIIAGVVVTVIVGGVMYFRKKRLTKNDNPEIEKEVKENSTKSKK